jgi:hypothetical protein
VTTGEIKSFPSLVVRGLTEVFRSYHVVNGTWGGDSHRKARGRRADTRVRLHDDLLALTLEGHGERAPTLLLTLKQARRLQTALAELIERAESGAREQKAEEWQGEERRRLAS